MTTPGMTFILTRSDRYPFAAISNHYISPAEFRNKIVPTLMIEVDHCRKGSYIIEQALSHIPQDTTILEHYALILEKLGLSDQAMEKWRQILKLDPAHEMAHRKVN